MKRFLIAGLCLLQFFILAFTFKTADVEIDPMHSMGLPPKTAGENSSFVLPASLLVIEDEAFEGTSASDVRASDSLLSIGENAFSEMPELRSVWLPSSLTQIAESAFPQKEGLLVIAPMESFARRWAEAQGYRFLDERIASVPVAQLLTAIGNVLWFATLFGLLPLDDKRKCRMNYPMDMGFVNNPKDRPALRVLALDFP